MDYFDDDATIEIYALRPDVLAALDRLREEKPRDLVGLLGESANFGLRAWVALYTTAYGAADVYGSGPSGMTLNLTLLGVILGVGLVLGHLHPFCVRNFRTVYRILVWSGFLTAAAWKFGPGDLRPALTVSASILVAVVATCLFSREHHDYLKMNFLRAIRRDRWSLA